MRISQTFFGIIHLKAILLFELPGLHVHAQTIVKCFIDMVIIVHSYKIMIALNRILHLIMLITSPPYTVGTKCFLVHLLNARVG